MIGKIIDEIIQNMNILADRVNIEYISDILISVNNTIESFKYMEESYSKNSREETEEINFKLYQSLIKKYEESEEPLTLLDEKNRVIKKENKHKELMFLYVAYIRRAKGIITPYMMKDIGKEAFEYIVLNSFVKSFCFDGQMRWGARDGNDESMNISTEKWANNLELSEDSHFTGVPFYSEFFDIFYHKRKLNELGDFYFYDLGKLLEHILGFYQKGGFDPTDNVCNTILAMPILKKMIDNLSDYDYNEELVKKLLFKLTHNIRVEIPGLRFDSNYSKHVRLLHLIYFITKLDEIINSELLSAYVPVIKDIAVSIKEIFIKYTYLYINGDIDDIDKTHNFITERTLKKTTQTLFNSSDSDYCEVAARESLKEINKKATYDLKLKNDVDKIIANGII